MSDPYSAAQAMLDDAERQLHRRREEAERLHETLSTMQVVGANGDGSVKVKIDSTGALADIKFTPAALQSTPDELRAEIMRGVRAAQRHLTEKVNGAVSDVYGSESATTSMFTDQYASRFGRPDPDEKKKGDRHV